MFIYNNKKYNNVWFTSDEHYGSDRHIELSKRIEFDNRSSLYNKLMNIDIPENQKKTILNSFYGKISETAIDKMNNEIIQKHNSRVGDNDIVFHLGDFGDYSYAKHLNGHHVLIMGNYEYDDCKKKYENSFSKFRDVIMSGYHFIDVLKDFTISTEDRFTNPLLMKKLMNEVQYIYMTHKPEDCIYNEDDKTLKTRPNGRLIMNLFGHIHEKGKIKRFGVNVGVDCNHFYPMSSLEVEFYLYAILHHYDENVFM